MNPVMESTSMTKHIKLATHIDLAAADSLRSELIDARDQEVDINAADVVFIGTLGLQVLLAAKRDWSRNDVGFLLSDCSEAFSKTLTATGVPLLDIDEEVSQ
jgi:chemotaxis protein CheX